MTPRTRVSAKTASTGLFAFLLTVLGACAVTMTGPFRFPDAPAIHLSGDGAPQVFDALRSAPVLQFADDPANARLEVVLLRRSENVRHVPKLARLCAGVCDRQAVTVFHILHPFDARRILVVNLQALSGKTGAEMLYRLDRGQPLAQHQVACLVQLVAGEVPSVPPPSESWGHPCGTAPERKIERVLPYGL